MRSDKSLRIFGLNLSIKANPDERHNAVWAGV